MTRRPGGGLPAAAGSLRLATMLGSVVATAGWSQSAPQPVVAPPPAASRVTPRTLAPETAPRSTVELPQTEAPILTGDGGGASFTPAAIDVAGGFADLHAAERAILEPLERHSITLPALLGAAARIEAAYQRAGYPLVRIVVVKQPLADGATIQLRLVDGFIESIDLTGVAPALRKPIARVLKPLVGKRGLRAGMLERRMVLAGDIPGATIRSTLAPGSVLGAVKLVIQAKRKLVEGSLSYDNRLGASFHYREATLQVALNGLSGWGDQIYSFVSSDPVDAIHPGRTPLRRVYGGGIFVPIGGKGMRLNAEASTSRTRPLGGFFAIDDHFDRFALRLSYPLRRTREIATTLTVAYEFDDERNAAPDFGVDLFHDRYDLARIVLDHSAPLPFGGTFYASATLTRGFGSPSADTPFSRGAATRRFTMVEAQLNLAHPLPLGFVARITGRAQTILAGGPPTAELFGLDGPGALSSYESGSLSADKGWTARGELRHPIVLFRERLIVTPFAYGAAGRAYYLDPTPFDISHAEAAGVGADVNLQPTRTGPGLFASVDYGWRLGIPGLPKKRRITVSAGVRF